MIASNEEEGFAQDAPSELAEYSYFPCPAFRDTHRRTYLNPLKLKPAPKTPPITPQHFINKDLQQLLLSKFSAKYPLPHYCPNGSPFDGNLSFDSAFESGNLQYVISSSPNTYDLFIKPDSNTMTHFQWFYFRVRNRRACTVIFVIKNFLKDKMSYGDGLRPFCWSAAKKHVNYEQVNSVVIFGPADASKHADLDLFQLSFEYCFEQANDEVYFCSQPPYPYSRFIKIYKCLRFTRVQISRTVLGNKIQAFLINQHINSKVLIVAMARQHPGESVGSWMMEGFVNRLLQSQKCYSWILIPMVNIDGVILGNNRTGVQGYDFNRHWYIDQEANRYHLFPQLKGIIAYFQKKRKENSKRIKIYIDFHGHSSQQNVFAYGPPLPKSSQLHNISKVLPFLISKRNPNFSFKQCSYLLQPYKKSCSRSVFFNKFGFTYSYTIQSSFGLYRGKRVNQDDMLRVGADIFESVLQFACLVSDSRERNREIKDILNVLKEEIGESVSMKGGMYDSDSENQDESAPIRRKFEQKLTIMLTKQAEQLEGSFFQRLTKKRDNNSYLGRESRYVKVNASIAVTRNNKLRLRTELTHKASQLDEGHLPRLKWQDRQKRVKNTKRSVTPCDLDRLSLQEMKERLIRMKHSELGRRILIIDSHNTT